MKNLVLRERRESTATPSNATSNCCTRTEELGSTALSSKARGPKRNYRRTGELVRQVIRHRFLDPEASVEVIAQKLRQTEFAISTRSVERVIAEYGLQKKTLHLPSPKRAAGHA